jgi:hypothetical protein
VQFHPITSPVFDFDPSINDFGIAACNNFVLGGGDDKTPLNRHLTLYNKNKTPRRQSSEHCVMTCPTSEEASLVESKWTVVGDASSTKNQ